jgi:hypothetical protein
MSILFVDGCDWYATSGDIIKKWSNIDGSIALSTSTGRFGGGTLKINGVGIGGQSGFRGPIGLFNFGTYPQGRFGFSFKIIAGSGPCSFAAVQLASNAISSNDQLLGLRISGVVANVCNAVTPTTHSSINVNDNAWHWIEVGFNQSTLAVTVYVDGVTNFTFTATSSQIDVTYDTISLSSTASGSSPDLSFDDIIIWQNDSLGLTTSPIGLQRIYTEYPTSDSTQADFTRSTGTTGFNLINDVGDGDSSYIESAVSNNKDLYNYGPITSNPDILGVTAVVINNYAKNPGSGTINYEAAVKSGATSANGTSKSLGGSYTLYQDVFMQDPNTSAAWTLTNLNNAQFGVKVV